MLPKFYRIIVVNNSGQTVTFNNNGRFNLKFTAWTIDPTTLKITYHSVSDDDLSFVAADACADGAEEKSDEYDNTSNLYSGLLIQLEVIHDEGAAAIGTFNVYLDGGDATGELSSDASGYNTAEANRLTIVGSLRWESNGLDDETMRSAVMHV